MSEAKQSHTVPRAVFYLNFTSATRVQTRKVIKWRSVCKALQLQPWQYDYRPQCREKGCDTQLPIACCCVWDRFTLSGDLEQYTSKTRTTAVKRSGLIAGLPQHTLTQTDKNMYSNMFNPLFQRTLDEMVFNWIEFKTGINNIAMVQSHTQKWKRDWWQSKRKKGGSDPINQRKEVDPEQRHHQLHEHYKFCSCWAWRLELQGDWWRQPGCSWKTLVLPLMKVLEQQHFQGQLAADGLKRWRRADTQRRRN